MTKAVEFVVIIIKSHILQLLLLKRAKYIRENNEARKKKRLKCKNILKKLYKNCQN